MMAIMHPPEPLAGDGAVQLFGDTLFRSRTARGPRRSWSTHEEVVVHLDAPGREELPQLPITLYQIQTKSATSRAPLGIVRTREFLMKDGSILPTWTSGG